MLVVGVLAGLTAGGGVGVIAASSTKVTVCASNKTNMLRYAKNGKCATTETKVVLNQTGARGAPGTNATLAITQQSVCDGSDAGMVANELCKIGMTGPGGGHIFFVDYNDQYPGFDYLEAAPKECENVEITWASESASNDGIFPSRGWEGGAVGQGQANTSAIVAYSTSDTAGNNAAKYADSLNCGQMTDWFLGSIGEVILMEANLRQAGVGGMFFDNYWSSSELEQGLAWYLNPNSGQRGYELEDRSKAVRPIRAF